MGARDSVSDSMLLACVLPAGEAQCERVGKHTKQMLPPYYYRNMPEDDEPWADFLRRTKSLETFGARSQPPRPNPATLACENLIEKAVRSWEADRPKAMKYIHRAAQYPYDPTELSFPGLWAAHMALFMDVTDAAEQSDIDDKEWLVIAVELLEQTDTSGRIHLANVLVTIEQDYHVSAREHATIAAALAHVDTSTNPQDPDDPATPPQALRETIQSIVALVAAYRSAWDE